MGRGGRLAGRVERHEEWTSSGGEYADEHKHDEEGPDDETTTLRQGMETSTVGVHGAREEDRARISVRL